MRKVFKFIKRTVIGLILILLLLSLYYLVFPNSFIKQAKSIFYPTININEKYDDNIVLETPAVYELMQVISAFTEVSQNTANLLDKSTTYYKEVEKHFKELSHHEIVKSFNASLVENGNNATYNAARFLSLSYQIDDQNNISYNKDINIMRWLMRLAGLKFFTMEPDISLIEDFAKKSNFIQFYNAHENYYKAVRSDVLLTTDFEGMRSWLENRAKFDYNSYRVIYSSLTGGSHFTVSLKDKRLKKEQVLIFVSPVKNDLDSMTIRELEIQSAWSSRVSFTEIDHNYVNPITDKYLAEVNDAMPDYTKWNKKNYNNSYETPYGTFNEYMTWGLFSLYAKEKFSIENLDTILQIHTDFMVDRRGFHRFKDFNNELLRQDSLLNQPKLEALYPVMLNWIKEN